MSEGERTDERSNGAAPKARARGGMRALKVWRLRPPADPATGERGPIREWTLTWSERVRLLGEGWELVPSAPAVHIAPAHQAAPTPPPPPRQPALEAAHEPEPAEAEVDGWEAARIRAAAALGLPVDFESAAAEGGAATGLPTASEEALARLQRGTEAEWAAAASESERAAFDGLVAGAVDRGLTEAQAELAYSIGGPGAPTPSAPTPSAPTPSAPSTGVVG
jgi:hypothetical protein